MPEIKIGTNESLERAMRRFKRMVEKEGILRQIRDRREYQKPSEKRRKKLRNKGGGANRY